MNSSEHQVMFADFVAAVKTISGVDPHITMVGLSGQGLSVADRVWRGGCYANCYNFATAELLWRHFSAEQVAADPEAFERWVTLNWKGGFPIRKERKAVKNPARFSACLISFAQWQQAKDLDFLHYDSYQAAHDDFTTVRYMGPYIAMRFLEYMRRYVTVAVPSLPDFRPVLVYPRQPLALMWPDRAEALLGKNTDANMAVCHQTGSELQAFLAGRGQEVNFCS